MERLKWVDMENRMMVSTVEADDTRHSYETAVCHPKFRNGKWIIVEEYDSVKDAECGHRIWITKMQLDDYNYLEDVSTAEMALLADLVDKNWRIFYREGTVMN